MPECRFKDNLSPFFANRQHFQLPQAEISYWPDFLGEAAISRLRTELAQLAWQQPEIMIYGRKVAVPRYQVWMGDAHCHYRYSGVSFSPSEWTPEIQALAQLLNQQLQLDFNCVLLNWYRDGNDSMGWHSDNEPELGENPTIASVSLGQTRRFDLKHRQTNTQLQIELAHGSLLLMAGECQHFWLHQLPKQKQQHAARYNLTFRHIAKNYK